MDKTIVVAAHAPGPHENGTDGCHARIGYDGMCPGVQTAKWLNNLGPDKSLYGSRKVHNTRTGELLTNGDVRQNYLDGSNHVVAVDPELAKLYASERRTSASLRTIRKEIKRLETARYNQEVPNHA